MQAQVVILGAGPSGALTALQLRQQGIEDVLLLDAKEFPRHKTCGSGLSPTFIDQLRALGVWDRVEPLAYRIEGMRLTTPKEQQVDLPAKGIDVAVCNRTDLDHALLQAAIDAGARFESGFKARGVVEEQGRVVGVDTSDGRLARGRYVVIATGAHAPLAIRPEHKATVQTLVGWYRNLDFRPHWMDMIYDAELVPYYGWLFPESAERVNIGITFRDFGEKRSPRVLFQRFLDKHYGDRIGKAEQIGRLQGHPIVWAYRLPKLTSPGRLVIGEAGRMVHPATGEGLSYAARSATYAADAIVAAAAGRSESWAWRRYQTRCALACAPPFAAGAAFMGMVRTSWVDRLVAASSNETVNKFTHRLFSKV